VLYLTFNIAQAAPHHGGNGFHNFLERLQSKLAEIKNNIKHNIHHGGHGIGHNIGYGGHGGGGGGGACR
jgi:hypothetical protein